MIKYLLITFLCFLLNSVSLAKHQNEPYEPNGWDKFLVKGSENYYKFQSELVEDKDVKKEIDNSQKTGLISYLLFEDDKIKIDEESLPNYIRSNNGIMPSHSVGKSLVSYVTGHAIWEGYIESVNEKLTGWKTVENTLFENQFLIDLLNMQAGDDKYVGERLRPARDNILKKFPDVNINTIPLKFVMKKYFQNSKRDIPSFNAKKPKYNYYWCQLWFG